MMDFAKNLLHTLPEKFRARLAHHLISQLPLRERINIYEHIDFTAELDFPDKPLMMYADNPRALSRLKSCKKEPETITWLRNVLGPTDVFYDVGANVGAYSLVAHALTDGQCQIFSFEPGFATFYLLNKNVWLNQANIVVFPFALTDKSGMSTFHYSSVAAGAAIHGVGQAVDHTGKAFMPEFTQHVAVARLDDVIAQFGLPRPTAMKIDIDGGETNMLQGANETLRHERLRTLLIEIDDVDDRVEQVNEMLNQSGLYQVAQSQRGAKQVANYVFERKDSV
jgi:FkbM family methyltransferase